MEDMAENKSNADKDSDDPYAKASRPACLCAYIKGRKLQVVLPFCFREKLPSIIV